MTTNTMKAIRIHQYGGPEVVMYEDVPRPQEIAPDEVLIRVSAAGVNPVDYQLRNGFARQFFEIPFPYILGREVAGVIEQVGAQVNAFHVGEEVFALLTFQVGGFAEYVAVKASQVATKPKSLDFVHTSVVPVTSLTAWQALFEHGKLAAGQRVLIHAASGGVGLFAVQFAHAAGAYVLATTSGRNRSYIQELGADQVIDYTTTPFEEVAHDIDVVLEPLGGDVQARSWQTLRPGGTLVAIIQPPSEDEAKKHNVNTAFFSVRPDGSQLGDIAARIDRGEIKVVLEKVFDLHNAREALNLSEAGHVRGKVALRVR